MNLLDRIFWRPLHAVVNYLALRFDPKGVAEYPPTRPLWRLNDWLADRYLPNVALSQEQMNELAESLGKMLGLTAIYDEAKNFVGYVEETAKREFTDAGALVEDEVTTKIPVIEDVTDHAVALYDDSPSVKATRGS